MFSNDVIKIFKNVLGFSNSFVISYPYTYFKGEFGSVAGRIHLDRLVKESFEPFGIYDMGSFIKILSLFDVDSNDFDMVFEGNVIKISDGLQDVEYPLTDVSMILNGSFDFFDKLFEGTEQVPSVCDFKVDSNVLKRFSKASTSFKTFDTLFLQSENGELTLFLGNTDEFVRTSNRYSLKMDSDCSDDFLINIPLSSFLGLPDLPFDVSVKYSQKTGSYRVVFSNALYDFIVAAKSQ